MPPPASPLPLRRLLPPALGLTGLLLAAYAGACYLDYQRYLPVQRPSILAHTLWVTARLFAPALLALGLSLGYLTQPAAGLWYGFCRLALALGLVPALLWAAFLLWLFTMPESYPIDSATWLGMLLVGLPTALTPLLSLGSFWLRRRRPRVGLAA